MAEPVSSAATGYGAAKAIGLGGILSICIIFAGLVVFMTRMPRSRSEWVVGLISTVMSSLCGGAYVVMRYELQHYATDWIGMVVLGGILFSCGLPGWAIVRWVFNYINKHEGQDIITVVNDVRDGLKK